MQFQIEIDQDDVNRAVEPLVMSVVKGMVSNYVLERQIREKVNAAWSTKIDQLVAEMVDSEYESIKTSVTSAIERKLNAKLNKLLTQC